MNLNSSIFDRIRVKRQQANPTPRENVIVCDHPDCNAPGEFRAPKGRNREGQYFCFCLDHVREYNQSYNYFNGMSDDDVARYQKDAVVGHRPTWTMGARRADGGAAADTDPEFFVDPLGVMRSRAEAARRKGARPEPQGPRVGVAAAKALDTLGLDDTATPEAIRARYKELVKRLHPDANGGDRSREEKLREIIQAYKHLRTARLA
jgi:curved DNA-binding protein CbpA